ncbi:caspase family protein [Neomegalonema sp.]|uniref:caspase family protein n=1 Tax=Neomegalonema sp. TaxID=2039713 RepID=UPI002608C673|nr:caspase family protein [Neomegalonema sp.]MDD2870012.1 caspase family protein [Neomegalonema sp.]
MRRRMGLLACLLPLALWSPPLRAEPRALTIGINAYDHERPLSGAVADARDIARSLGRLGVRDVTSLLDRKADRAAVEAAWRAMVARAAPGDLLILTYSGHGGHEPDLNGDEALLDPRDVSDEHFALSGFSSRTPQERILDDELDLWFREALEKGLRVLFVADSCHSGSMHRGGGQGRRASPSPLLQNEASARSFTPPAALAPPRPPPPEAATNFFFVSAVDQAGTVNEVTIRGARRGALSHLFARALDGAADANRDGAIDHLELGAYLEAALPSLDNAVRRKFHPGPGGAPHVLFVRPEGPPPGPAPILFPDLRLSFRGGPAPEPPSGLRIAQEGEAPDLVYDLEKGDVLDDSGARIAEGIRLFAPELRAILDKLRVVRLVQEMATRAPAAVEISPDQDFHRIGADPVEISVVAARPWLTLFNLANTGEVQRLFPLHPGEEAPQEASRSFVVTQRPSEPVGADHLILLLTEEEPVALRSALETQAGTPRLLEILREMSLSEGVSASVAALYVDR